MSIRLPESVTLIDGPGGLPHIQVRNRAASATLALQGAHLLSFRPQGEEDLLWLSEEARYAPGKSIRGGIPVCWPWFGAHATDNTLPAHGHARTQNWQLLRATYISAHKTELEFTLLEDEASRHLWPYKTPLRYTITIGRELGLCLHTTNLEQQAVSIGSALHTYFHVGEVERIAINGLDGCDYLDKTEGFARKHQIGMVKLAGETDRIYLQSAGRCDIRDPILKRRIVIHSQGSRSTVVWNPGQAVAERMGDLGVDGYRHMVCVETANAAEDVVVLAPGQVHRLAVVYRIAAL